MMISIYVMSFIIPLILTIGLVPVNIRLSNKLGMIDQPDERRIHKKPIALAGGLSFAIPIVLMELSLAIIMPEYRNRLLEMAIGGSLIGLLGYLDDKRGFTARYKLVFQILLVSVMYIAGYRMNLLTNPFGSEIRLGIFSFPFTVLWYLAVINAFNLIDGLDGLAAGIAAIVSGVILTVGIINHDPFVSLLSLILMAGCLGFLNYNFYPARIFMGDTGALFLGFNIASICISGVGQFKGITTMTLLIPIATLALPLIETFNTIFRRMKDNQHIFKADKEHIHHKLLELGYSQKTIALALYFITFLFGLIAIGFSFSNKRLFLLILIVMVFILFILINLLYSKEFKK
ncbi:MAG: undecaprenyl/decaprenyl-phosphate alpha-N-acetylglucosaminyl 1-phosphate transferase [Candidatus Cloacimonetes bacterium]|nr:undecaprenyl/decaprenyl-phosphate alpha-N-acetylglucosaminyl 1-phosphate transferase [Candidatus Cloacimonadota bacterium]